MSFRNRVIRALGIGLILVIAQAVPAAAEKITLKCGYGAGYAVSYYTIDTNARTVSVDLGASSGFNGTYPAEITEYAVVWESRGREGKCTVPATTGKELLLWPGRAVGVMVAT